MRRIPRLPLTGCRSYSLFLILVAVIGIVRNLLDLTAGTHFTKDPGVGIVISILSCHSVWSAIRWREARFGVMRLIDI